MKVQLSTVKRIIHPKIGCEVIFSTILDLGYLLRYLRDWLNKRDYCVYAYVLHGIIFYIGRGKYTRYILDFIK